MAVDKASPICICMVEELESLFNEDNYCKLPKSNTLENGKNLRVKSMEPQLFHAALLSLMASGTPQPLSIL